MIPAANRVNAAGNIHLLVGSEVRVQAFGLDSRGVVSRRILPATIHPRRAALSPDSVSAADLDGRGEP